MAHFAVEATPKGVLQGRIGPRHDGHRLRQHAQDAVDLHAQLGERIGHVSRATLLPGLPLLWHRSRGGLQGQPSRHGVVGAVDAQHLLGVHRQADPSRVALRRQIFYPLQELLALPRVRRDEVVLLRQRHVQLEVGVEALFAEQVMDERPQDGMVELVVDAAAVDGLRQHGLDGIPRDLVGADVGQLAVLRHAVNPRIDDVAAADLVGIRELVLLGPAHRVETQALQDDGVEERQQEMKSAPLDRHPVRLIARQHLREGPLQGGLNATGRLEDVHTRQANQIRRDPGVELHGQEEPEVLVRIHAVQLLLQLREPLDGQVHILEQHPSARFRTRGDGLVGEGETLLRTHGNRGEAFARGLGQLGDLSAGVVARNADHHDRRGGLAVLLEDVG
mmetsp:Transcript_110735/g.352712  ORF Transcript_110735/g.352712 Transcript_110735/m.352712 type:complete len:391 (-) Transcript_110735:12038-13210(-)